MRALLVAGLLFVACKKDPAPVADAGPVAPKKALPSLPTAPSTLSLLEPGDGGCAWKTLDPATSTTTTLVTFPGTCVGGKLAWSPDAGSALAWFDPQHLQHAGYAASSASKPGFGDETADETATPRLYAIDFQRFTVTPVAFPPTPESHSLDELGVGADGAPLALFVENLSDAEEKQKSVTRNGQTFDFSDVHDGLPAIAHAFRFSGGAWKRVESAATTTGWDYALGIQALEAFQTLGPRSDELSSSNAQGDAATDEEKKALQPLVPAKAGPDDGEWIFVGAGGARVYVWEVAAEFAYTTGLLATGTPPRSLPLQGFTDGDMVSVRTSGPWLLVTASDVGTHPRLFALPQGKAVFTSDTARAVTFWPTTTKAESHEK